MAYTYNGVLFSLQKEGHFMIWDNTYELWWYYAKWNKAVTEGQILHEFQLYEISKIVQLIESRVEWWLARAWKRGKWGVTNQQTQSFS